MMGAGAWLACKSWGYVRTGRSLPLPYRMADGVPSGHSSGGEVTGRSARIVRRVASQRGIFGDDPTGGPPLTLEGA